MADSCAESGYAETTIEAVTRRAGVGRESFYSHFADKEDCGVATLNRIVSDALAAIAISSEARPEVEGRVFQAEAILEVLSSRPSFARIGSIEARQGASRRMRDSYDSAMHVLALMLERARGEGPSPPTAAARAALGGAEAVARREIAAGRAGNLLQLLPDFIYAALVPFVGQREALRQSKVARKLVIEEE